MQKKNVTLGIFSALVCEVIFGFSFLFTKQATTLTTPLTLLSWRFLVAFASISLLKVLGILQIDFKGKSLRPLLLISFLAPVVYFIGEVVGVSLTTTAESGTMIACIPIVTVLFAAKILKEVPSRTQLMGFGIATLGVIGVVLSKSNGFETSLNPLGYASLFIAVTAYGLFAVLSQRLTEFNSAEKTFVMMLVGAIVFTTIACIEQVAAGTLRTYLLLPLQNLDFLISILYLGLGSSVIAFLFYNTALHHLGASRTASFAGLTTIITVLAGVVLLKESFSYLQGAATILVLLGVYLANSKPGTQKTDSL
ncbi:MAG: DMT family transporter [Tissierellia bacterium]|nr:DMT family transporter [Tissierellia bacterium]